MDALVEGGEAVNSACHQNPDKKIALTKSRIEHHKWFEK